MGGRTWTQLLQRGLRRAGAVKGNLDGNAEAAQFLGNWTENGLAVGLNLRSHLRPE